MKHVAEIVFLGGVFTLIALFAGEPDIADALIKYLGKQ